MVSERLAEQVLHGLHELLRGFQAAQDASHGQLLHEALDEDPDNVYRALLTVVLRLVFVLYAEERGLLSDDPTFLRSYSMGGLYERLREDAALNPDTMDQRYGAWAQLLVLFRMIHDGAECDGMKLPPRRGELFSPSRFPFLEGWPGSGAPQTHEAIDIPLVPDGTIYRVLEKLLVLDGERISYRALDVEQIGSVYETMMGFRLETATGRSAAVKAQKKLGASTTVDLEQLQEVAPAQRAKWILDRTGRKLTPTVSRPLRAAQTIADAHAALHNVIDAAATPDLVTCGAMILQPSEARRRSGSHYTPRELTEPIVRHALEPILERLGDGGTPRAEQILDLKICDPAMGSGAFLVEVCRQLGDHLVTAWRVHGTVPALASGEDEDPFARRLVAQRCLYGVDRNPMAVDLAKMSLWLATLAKDEPLTFVDHALRDGDSLVGLTKPQIAAFTWKRGPLPPQLELNTVVSDAVDRVVALRREIRDAPPDIDQQELRDKLDDANAALTDVRFYGDLALEAFFLETKAKQRKARRQQHFAALLGDSDTEHVTVLAHRERLTAKRKETTPFAPFHWEIEFPEVFERRNRGFDAFVGNPPFAGKNTVAASNVPGYPLWLKEVHAESHGNADLVAHFFRRSFNLLRDDGTLGLIATNTIAQGDTRSTGLRWICTHGGEIYRAQTRFKWPGVAAVVVSVLHVVKGRFRHRKSLDGAAVERITAFLFHAGGHDDPAQLKENADQSFQGSIVLGMGFTFDDTDTRGVATSLAEMERIIAKDPHSSEVIFPYIGGQEVNTSPTHAHHRYVIDFRERTEQACRIRWPELIQILEERVKPDRERQNRRVRRERWWQHAEKAAGLYEAVSGLDRVLAINCGATPHLALAFLPARMVFANTLVIFPLSTYAAFCALQSRVHEVWARFFGSSMKDDLRYTPSDCFETFLFPPSWHADPVLERVGKACYEFRARVMVDSEEGLTKTYNRFHDPNETDPAILRLRELHADMDRAVLDAYGWTDIPTQCEFLLDHATDEDAGRRGRKPYRYRWPDDVRDEVLARLLVLDSERAHGGRQTSAGGVALKNRRTDPA